MEEKRTLQPPEPTCENDPLRTCLGALKGRIIDSRPTQPVGTNANQARFKGMNVSSKWPGNRLLLALPPRNLKLLIPELDRSRCQCAQFLMDADSSFDHGFFPDSCFISVVAVYADGHVIEMATIGRE